MAGGRFDLAAYRSSQSELAEETFDIYLGETKDEDGNVVEDIISIPNPKHWPLYAQVMLGNQNIEGGLGAIIGPEKMQRLLSPPPEGIGMTNGEFQEIFEQLAQFSGFQTGQPSSAPPPPGLTPKLNSPS